VNEYEKLSRIGEGTYGVVYRARERKTGKIVALKRIRFEERRKRHRENRASSLNEEGFPITALREVLLLQRLQHPNIVGLLEVVVKADQKARNDAYFLVFEYCENDLGKILDEKLHPYRRKFTEAQVKGFMLQIISGVQYLHSQWVIHRDLKLCNLLYNSQGEVKLADFGLAREFGSPLKAYSPVVVSLWYRAPELLLRDTRITNVEVSGGDNDFKYSTAVDAWSLGCIFAELLLGAPLFPGRDEIDQLYRIFDVLGIPSQRIWSEADDLLRNMRVHIQGQPYNKLRQVFSKLSENGLDLLDGLLTYDPRKRFSAEQALDHEYFSEDPTPDVPSRLPTFSPSHF